MVQDCFLQDGGILLGSRENVKGERMLEAAFSTGGKQRVYTGGEQG